MKQKSHPIFLVLITLACAVGFAHRGLSARPSKGHARAQEYFKARAENAAAEPGSAAQEVNGADQADSNVSRDPAQSSSHFMALHVATFVDDQAHSWGGGSGQDDVASWNAGVTYRIGEWTNSMDLQLRTELMGFDVRGESPLKLAFVPVITFPDVSSEFPLYFGAGLGLGVFLEQIENESALTLDYQLFSGLRILNLYEATGVFLEFGLKNHLHLLSNGQFNGVFVAVGATFNF